MINFLRFKIAKYEKEHPDEVKTHETDWNPNPNFTWQVHFEEYDDTYRDDTRSEEQKADDLGILYAMFGSTYTTQIRGHVYKVRFKKQTSKSGAFYRVYSDIYRDDKRICEDVIIGFWPWRTGDDRCGDMQFADMGIRKKAIREQDDAYWDILDELKNLWNYYFDSSDDSPKLSGSEQLRIEQHNIFNRREMEELFQYLMM